jgi:hypothetical protein
MDYYLICIQKERLININLRRRTKRVETQSGNLKRFPDMERLLSNA